MKAWIFQANPDRYRLKDSLRDSAVKRRDWQVNQYENEIKQGDLALIWLAGASAGIYATAEIISSPKIMPESADEKKYWMDQQDSGADPRLRVEIKIQMNLVSNPLLKSDLINISSLASLSIFRMPQSTNFTLSSDEWKVIRGKIDQRLRAVR